MDRRCVCTVCMVTALAFPIQKCICDASLAMFGRIGGQAVRCAARRPVARRKLCERKFSAHTGVNAAPTSTPSPLGGITVELDRIAPRFEVSASKITILDSPASFYSTLKVRIPPEAPSLTSANCICTVQNSQCQTSCLPLHALYRQDRVRVDRDCIPRPARQP